MSINDKVEPIKQPLPIFFVIDTSGNMAGLKIAALNHAIEEFVPEIKKISMENEDVQIKIAVLKFDNSAEWITKNGPEEVETFVWRSLDAGGLANFGEACKALNEKLSTRTFDERFYYSPVIYLFSASEPTDNWQDELAKLKQNHWFRWAVKVAVSIGDDTNKDMLAEFVGSPEGVITAHDPETLKKWIKFGGVHNDSWGVLTKHEMYLERHPEEKKSSLSISIISTIDDIWCNDINAEVLSISPSRNYIICKSEKDKKLLIVKCSNNSDAIYKSDISFFAEIVDVSKIIWHESESYFDVYFDFSDKDQNRYLAQHICRYETKNFGHFEIEKEDDSNAKINPINENILVEPDEDDVW